MMSYAATASSRVQNLHSVYASAVARRRRTYLWAALAVVVFTLLAGIAAEINIPQFLANVHKFPNYIGRIFILTEGPMTGRSVLFDVTEWYWGIFKWMRKLGETLVMAYVATLLGAAGGFIACFFAASNLGVNPWLRSAMRRFLEFCRTVPDMVFALIFVLAFGLGPMAGVLAIAVHTVGALGKLFSEVLENIDQKPLEGLIASGASWTKAMRFSVLPQVLANFTSYALLRFEINVRGASVMGFVGAGGIGQDLMESIRKFYYTDVSAILLLIIFTVFAIDLVTERIRHRFIAQGN